MRVTINPILNSETLQWLPRPSYNYFGPGFFFKGDNTAQTAETRTLGFDQVLQNLFQMQYQHQSSVLSYLTNLMNYQLGTGGQGFTPVSLVAQRTAAADTIARQGRNAQIAANAAAVRAGGSALPSGVSAQIESDIAAQTAEEQAQAQNQITQENELLRQQNYWKSVDVLSGVAQQQNPLGYAQAPISAGNTIANLSTAVTNASQPTWLQALGGIVGGAAQGALGNPNLKI